MKLGRTIAMVSALVALTAAPSASASANKGFEKCSLQGWGHSIRGEGFWKVYGDKNRKLRDYGKATLPRPFGRCAAAFVQDGPSDGALVRKITVPDDAISLSVRYFFINQAGPAEVRSNTREYSSGVSSRALGPWYDYGQFSNDVMGPNQFFSIDLIRKSAGGRTTRSSNILERCYSPTPGKTPARSRGWRKCVVPLYNLRGQAVKLRLAAVDNSYYLNVGLDRLRVQRSQPSPAG